jgi:error-prone DNA polymerase
MTDPFVHLRVASGYSLRYGASHPSSLVERAAEYDMDTLALTDRDGLYGAVRFAKACMQVGIAPILGVDLAVPFALPMSGSAVSAHAGRTPTRGGAIRDLRLPRVVLLATSKAGWAALCRLVSATHLSGARGEPVSSHELIAQHASSGDVMVMLGADSEVGTALAAERPELAEELLRRWREIIDSSQLALAVTHHQAGGSGAGSLGHAARMLALADSQGITGVLTNMVRMSDRHLAPTVDVLDSVRRLVALDSRHVDRRNAEGYLKSGKEMQLLAEEVASHAGRGEDGGHRLLAQTRALAMRCILDPRRDLGLGETHLPELSVLNGAGEVISQGSSEGRVEALAVLQSRCDAGIARCYGVTSDKIDQRLLAEIDVVRQMGYSSYFLTVADVVDLIKEMGVRCAARGSGAGSLINYLLGISGIDPLRHGLVMERFLSPLRQALPDVDIDVESDRRLEVYEKILANFGGERVACVAMLDTYRVRHAVRDVGAALSLPPGEIDAIAKAFPHIRARDARSALRDLPELRAAGLGERRLDLLFSLVESLDGLPRHIALHPCGVLLSDATLLDRTPVEASFGGYPMSQFDKDDVEDLGLLKLDVLGIRMQSSMAHAITEISRTEGVEVDVDALELDDPDTFALIRTANTLGCFQIESPGQRELIGKFAPETFNDIMIDISLFRPGPVKSDMVTPFLESRQGWKPPYYIHPSLEQHLSETSGVVVFHEQVIKIISTIAGCSLAVADEARRGLGDWQGKDDVKAWLIPRARKNGYSEPVIDKIWAVLEAFASFGFCKAHAAAFALPTYQSAWLKAHYPAHFLSGVLTHDPGMYPKRLILEEARRLGIAILSLDVNASTGVYHVEQVGRYDEPPPQVMDLPPRLAPGAGLPDGRDFGIRLSLADVKGINETEIDRIVAGQPYSSLSDFWFRTRVSHPVAERLVLAGAFDSIYGIGAATPVRRPNRVTRRDLLLAVADLQRSAQADVRAAARARGLRRTPLPSSLDRSASSPSASPDPGGVARSDPRGGAATRDPSQRFRDRREIPGRDVASAKIPGGTNGRSAGADPRDLARAQSAATEPARPQEIQLAFDFESGFDAEFVPSGLPEMSDAERVRAELSILGLDASRHMVDFYLPLLRELGVTFSADLLSARSRSELLIGGVKVATQTPPVRSGRRVVFLTLDDTTGPVDATFFEDAQGPYAATLFSSWMLLVRGELRRTGPRGVSLRATGCWDLNGLFSCWRSMMDLTGDPVRSLDAVHDLMAQVPAGFANDSSTGTEQVEDGPDGTDGLLDGKPESAADAQQHTRGGGMGRRRVLVHPSGFRQSPYADIKPAGVPVTSTRTADALPATMSDGGAADAPRKLWHSSQGSSGR